MIKDKHIGFRTTEKTRDEFKKKLSDNFHNVDGIGNLMVDAYIKDPTQTVKVLNAVKKDILRELFESFNPNK